MEELLLQAFLVLHELHVVDEEDVALAVAPLERQGRRRAQGVDEVVHEGLGGHVEDLAPGEILGHVVADGVQEMGFAQTAVPVNEQWIV